MLDQFFLYHPTPWEDRDWAGLSRLPLEEIWFPSMDGTKLFGWFVRGKGQREKAPVLLWCHGNAGNLSHRLDNLAFLHRIGLSLFLFDYRGYGQSQGTPSEQGLYLDALGAYAYLTKERHVAVENVVLFGRSLGGAVAGMLAGEQRVAGLILESSFPSIGEVARVHYFGLPMHWFLGARFDLRHWLKRVTVPTLVVHGEQDTIIPFSLGRQVFDAVRGPKSFYPVPGADHNNLYQVGGAPYFQRLKEFSDRVTQ